jgi:inner membrane protein
MASAFAHIAVPAVLYASCKSDRVNIRLLFIASVLSVLPDADVIAFKFKIPYASQWGHRGFTHSLAFALVLAAFCMLFYRSLQSQPWVVLCFAFISCASHAVLDAMTNGGVGVALYWPFSLDRIFLPFRPIQVSPIGVGSFFTEKGVKIILSELVWVLIPALALGSLGALLRHVYTKKS